MRRLPILVALIVVGSVVIMPQTVAANNEWSDRCSTADTITPGTYSGDLSPEDTDAFIIELSEGDFIEGTLSFDTDNVSGIDLNEGTEFSPYTPFASEFTVTSENRWYQTSLNNRNIEVSDDNVPDNEPARFRLYNEGPEDRVCVAMSTRLDGATPWEFSFSSSEAEIPETGSESEVSDLQSRISELESQLEQKNQTISELESRIEELESQSSGESGGDVNIDVAVNPANGQNFVEGGEAIVQAESENADVSQMQVEYGAGTYELDSSGEVAIPLADTGTQELTIVHGETTEEASIDVQPRDGQEQQDPEEEQEQQDPEEEQEQQDPPTTGVNTPGFGIIATVVAILTGTVLLRRYR